MTGFAKALRLLGGWGERPVNIDSVGHQTGIKSAL